MARPSVCLFSPLSLSSFFSRFPSITPIGMIDSHRNPRILFYATIAFSRTSRVYVSPFRSWQRYFSLSLLTRASWNSDVYICIYILFKMYVRDTSVSRAMIRFDTLLSCWQQRAIVVNGYTVVTLSLLSRRLSLSHLSQKRTMFATILSNVSLWCLFAASDCLLVGPERALADGHTTVRHSHCQTQTTNDHE